MSDPAFDSARPTPTSRRHWYGSLYWRIAFGLVAFLALMLAAQGVLFLWTTDRFAGSVPARNPRQLAMIVASALGSEIAANPALSLEEYVRDEYGRVLQTFLVVMRDGRRISNHQNVPRALLESVAASPRPRREIRPEPPTPRGPRVGGPARRRGNRAGTPPFPREFVAPIVVEGELVGRVVVLPEGPRFTRVVSELGPTIGLLGGAVLLVGMGLIALVVFGPVRQRLVQVQEATERLGGGDLTARVPDTGSDEVAAVARSFNRMADELSARAHAIAAADTARRQLLADVSHELMTPLTAMRGYVDTLAMPELSTDPQTRARYLSIVSDETHRLERIIGDLLDLARLQGGGTTLRRVTVDTASLFARVAARHERELDERRIRFVHRVAAGAETLTGDPDRLEQALQNLATNALRHTPAGGEIRLDAAPVPAGVQIVVCDTGPGIPPEHVPLIFDRFYKVDAARRAAGGSGLGLSIVKAIIEAHGGTIAASNDHGAVFEIILPTRRHDPPPATG